MTDLIEILRHTIELQGFDDVVAVSAALLTALGAALSMYQSWARTDRRLRHQLDSKKNLSPLEVQIGRIRNYLTEQQKKERMSRWSHYLLSLSQYVVGAALTTSFVASNLTGQVLGVLGVMTLLSSFAQQLLRPDIKRLAAAQRVVRLQEILGRAEISEAEAKLRNNEQALLAVARQYLDELHTVQRDEWLTWSKEAKEI